MKEGIMMQRSKSMHIVITAGGTREYIDPVRFISNASSGRMGYALARAALRAGHWVTLITAPTALAAPKGAEVIPVETSEEMFQAVRAAFEGCDCLIMAAAVSDYQPARRSKTKIKKASERLMLELKPTRDILAWAGRHKQREQVLVGFALEDRDLLKNAEAKLQKKRLDMIVANAPAAIGADSSTVYIKTRSGDWHVNEDAAKARTAGQIIEKIKSLMV